VTGGATAVLEEAARLGVTLRAQAGQILARPKAAMTREFAAVVAAHRADVLALLAAAVEPPKTPCLNCRGTRFFARPERWTWICSRCHPAIDVDTVVWHEVSVVLRDA
jgi:hypothetical protein